MKQGIFTIKDNKSLTPTTYLMKLEGDTSAVTAPGQFINIRLDGHFLRRPISVNDADDSTITIIYKVLGHGTEEMTHFAPGKELDVLGSHLSPDCYPYVIENMASGVLKTAGVVTKTFPLEEWETAFDYATGKYGNIKVAITF